MALDKKVYKALEQVVGQDNISEEPCILDSYARQWQIGMEGFIGGLYSPTPEAVLLPGSTEEVQKILKLCNKHKIRSKPLSTGWGQWNAPSGEGVIQLDMRRMNRIVEIDEENMLAVVEPYVTCSQLQAEAMKKGLNCNIIGAGAASSPLASSTSLGGYGLSGISMGYNGRNVLGVEWVLPTGEVLKLGSLGSGAGWFCGDGPGPSLRGIMRGFAGAMGGLGVFTRVAIKLYPWPGPPVMPIEGMSPNYSSPLPENIRSYTLAFPDWDSFAEAWDMIGEAEIGYVMGKHFSSFGSSLTAVPYFMATLDPELDNDDIPQMLESPDIRRTIDELEFSFQFTIAARSPRDLEYQVKAMEHILAKTDGTIHPLFSDPESEKLLHVAMIKVDRNNTMFDMTGSFGTSFGFGAVPTTSVEVLKVAKDVKNKYIRKGDFMDDGGEGMWGNPYEHGRIGCQLEELYFYDPHDRGSYMGSMEYLLEAMQISDQKKWPGGLGVGIALTSPAFPPDIKQEILSNDLVANMFKFQGRIKRALDPNSASDGGGYIAPKEL